MKGRFAGAILHFAAVSAISASAAHAAFYEPFDYTASASTSARSLGNGSNVNPTSAANWFDGTNTQTNGNIWAANDANNTTLNDGDVASGSLGYNGLSWSPTANKAGVQSTAADFNRIQVDQEYGEVGSGGTTVFYSMLMQVSDLNGFTNTGVNGGFFTGLQYFPLANGVAGDNMSSNIATSAAPILMRRASATLSDGYQLGVGYRDQQDVAVRKYDATKNYNITDKLFLVVKMEFNTGNKDDVATLWVFRDDGTNADPIPLSEPGTFTVRSSSADNPTTFYDYFYNTSTGVPLAAAGTKSVRSIFVRGGTTSTPNGLEVDEIHVGDSWLAVVVPEPSAIALLGVVALGMPRRRRK